MAEAERKAVKPHAAEANRQGNLAMRAGQFQQARTHFAAAVEADPGQPALLFNLAGACHAAGQDREALAALEAALQVDPYFVQAVFQKGIVYGQLGARHDAARVFRDFLDMLPPDVEEGGQFSAAIAHAREVVEEDNGQLAATIAPMLQRTSRRVRGAFDHLVGAAPLYRSEPTFLTVPELPSIPFFERDSTPWLDQLEQDWPTILMEAESVFANHADDFTPYVAIPPGMPANQWQNLDRNVAWGSFFFWRHGVRNERNCAMMPRTCAALDRLPLLHLPGRGPNVLLSRLAARTRIPPHNGVTNARITVHLPLIVPPSCGFRVGPETREWRPGQAWAFDDTIDHEAWNDSDDPRLILILDAWNPALTAREREALRDALAGYDGHFGLDGTRQAEF